MRLEYIMLSEINQRNPYCIISFAYKNAYKNEELEVSKTDGDQEVQTSVTCYCKFESC